MKKDLIKNIVIGLLLSIVLTTLHVFFSNINGDLMNWYALAKVSFLHNAFYAIPFYVFNATAHKYARIKQLESELSPLKFWGAYLIIIVICNTLLAALLTLISNIIYSGYSNAITISQIDSYFFISSLFVAFVIGLFFYSYFYLKERFKEKTELQEEKISKLGISKAALQEQIGPHFLFNSLNVLSGLVDEDPQRAQSFIADLAQVYRYVLDQKDKDWVSVAEEIDFAENYLELINTRFENGLHIVIENQLKTSEEILPPLTLQLLLENCIKHNAITKENPLHIKIFRKDDYLIIQNNLIPKKKVSHRGGTGLAHIKQRYANFNKTVNIVQEKGLFCVKIPLLNLEEIN